MGGPGHKGCAGCFFGGQFPHLHALFLWRPAPSHARPYRAGRRDTSGAPRTPADKSVNETRIKPSRPALLRTLSKPSRHWWTHVQVLWVRFDSIPAPANTCACNTVQLYSLEYAFNTLSPKIDGTKNPLWGGWEINFQRGAYLSQNGIELWLTHPSTLFKTSYDLSLQTMSCSSRQVSQ